MSLDIHLGTSNIYYSRQWDMGALDNLSGMSDRIQKSQHIGKLIIPFIALYSPAGACISYSLGAWNLYQRSVHLISNPSYQKQDVIEIAKSVAEMAATWFDLRLGLIVNSALEIYQNIHQLYYNSDQRKPEIIAQVSSTALYLLSLLKQDSLGLSLSSLIFQACLNFYQSYLATREIHQVGKDLDHKKLLDSRVKAAMGAIRLYQAYHLNQQHSSFSLITAEMRTQRANDYRNISGYTSLLSPALQSIPYAAAIALFFKYASYINNAVSYAGQILEKIFTPSFTVMDQNLHALAAENSKIEANTKNLRSIGDQVASLSQQAIQLTNNLAQENSKAEIELASLEQKVQQEEENLGRLKQNIERIAFAIEKLQQSNLTDDDLSQINAERIEEAGKALKKAQENLSKTKDSVQRKISQNLPTLLKKCQELGLVEKELPTFYMLKILVESVEESLKEVSEISLDLAVGASQEEERISKLNRAVGTVRAYNNILMEKESELDGFFTKLEQMIQTCSKPA